LVLALPLLLLQARPLLRLLLLLLFARILLLQLLSAWLALC
jgi:hypothetical protein